MTCSRCSGVCTCTPAPASAVQADLLPRNDSDAWRQEVTDRLHRYRARRKPRPPRYPSPRLRFDAPEESWRTAGRETTAFPEAPPRMPIALSGGSPAVAVQYADPAPRAEEQPAEEPAESAAPASHRRHEAKIIEFPAPVYAVQDFSNALAEPILDRPRILEAPEVVPPPPALGGITIEQAAKAEPERRAGIDMPLQSASTAHRLLAGMLDALIVASAAGGFGVVFCRLTRVIPGLWLSVAVMGGMLGLFWFGYQYLFLVYCGTTPGLQVLRLQLEQFDGKPARRRLRRARALCHMLSLAALGMGYAWQFLDEDGLCWHERVTKTHIAAQEPSLPPH
jgi:uncharacterized RDD family membrane protein YckC